VVGCRVGKNKNRGTSPPCSGKSPSTTLTIKEKKREKTPQQTSQKKEGKRRLEEQEDIFKAVQKEKDRFVLVLDWGEGKTISENREGM